MKFNYAHFEEQLTSLKSKGYSFFTLEDYFGKKINSGKVVINRIDIDFSVSKAWVIFEILRRNDIRATWFFRFCSPKYNMFEFSTINLINELIKEGHEIGLHTELQDLQELCSLNPEKQFRKQINIINSFYDIKIKGSACHGDLTGNNNLDFWRNRNSSEFGLVYEAYDNELWENCRYISDSEWIRWKSYDNGVLIEGDYRAPSEHADEEPKVIYLLTHPDTYYHKSIHEG